MDVRVPKEILSDRDYRDAQQHLTRKTRPQPFLCAMMEVFERYRTQRKIGWTRPWNKNNLTVFRSFELRFPQNVPLCQLVADCIGSIPDIAAADLSYTAELLADPGLMGFVFLHDERKGSGHHEGFTVSLGRVSRFSGRHRDRLDLILECQVENNVTGPKQRWRAHVDPYTGDTQLREELSGPTLLTSHANLLAHMLGEFPEWESDPTRIWTHWTQEYIGAFGPRTSVPQNSWFAPRISG